MDDRLHQQALTFIRNLNPDHPACAELDLSLPPEELIKPAAAATRTAVVPVEVKPLDPDTPLGNTLIYRKDELPTEMLKRCLDETWISTGREIACEDKLDYNISPDPAFNSPNNEFGEWTWQVNRHHEWTACARVYAATNDEAYAQAVAGWLRRWLAACPVPTEAFNTERSSWRTIEIGIRMGNTWPQVISAFRDTEAFDDILWLAWLQSYAEQAKFVWEHRKTNNWLLMEMNGLMHAGVQIHFHKDAFVWYTNALNEFIRQLDIQFLDDGMQVELSTTYHGVCVINYLRAVQVMQAAGREIPEQLFAGIQKMIAAWHPLMKLDGSLFAFQDSGKMNLISYLEHNIPKELWSAQDNWAVTQKTDPPPKCSILPNAGYAVMRTGWDLDALVVAFDGGPLGDGHQHEDKLSFQVNAFGSDSIGEAGTVDYADTPERHYCLTTLAHSTALIDGLGQNRKEGYTKGSMDLHTDAGIEYDFKSVTPWVKASYTDGYGPGRAVKVVHTRTIRLESYSQIVVVDEFTAEDGAEHTAEVLFHVLKPDYDFNGSELKTTGKDRGNLTLSIEQAGGGTPEMSVICGGTEPDLRGWADETVARAARGYHWVEARPCVTITLPFTGSGSLTTILDITP